jgi:protein phosphatase
VLRQYRPALEYYRKNNVEAVVCEEKHTGSRAVVVVCRDEATAKVRFGVSALTSAGLWEKFRSAWFCLDCERMPWSVKAEDLLRTQYAPTGVAANAAVDFARTALSEAERRGLDVSELLHAFDDRANLVGRYVDAYRHYCWPVRGVEDIKLAPFHILASESAASGSRLSMKRSMATREFALGVEGLERFVRLEPLR